MARRYNSEEAKKRILAACARLFFGEGIHQHPGGGGFKGGGRIAPAPFRICFFRTKDGVLTEFVRIMFGSQFGAAKQMRGERAFPGPRVRGGDGAAAGADGDERKSA